MKANNIFDCLKVVYGENNHRLIKNGAMQIEMPPHMCH